MYGYTFARNQMAIGASSAVFMLVAIGIIIVPYIRSHFKEA
jgi:glucose/mannose transport system permease protein